MLLQRCLAWALVSMVCLKVNAWKIAVDYTGVCPQERSDFDLLSICLSRDSLVQCQCVYSEATDVDVIPPFDLLPAGMIRYNCVPVAVGDDVGLQQFQMFIDLCGENCYCVNNKKGKHIAGIHPPVWSQRDRHRPSQADSAAIIEAQMQAIIEKKKAEEEEARARAIAATWPAITNWDIGLPPRPPPPPPPQGGGTGGGSSGGGGSQSSGHRYWTRYGGSDKVRKTGGKSGQAGCASRCTQMQRCSRLSTRNSCADDLVCAATSSGPGFYLSTGRCTSRALLALSAEQLSAGATGMLGGRSVHEAAEKKEEEEDDSDDEEQPASWSTQLPIEDLDGGLTDTDDDLSTHTSYYSLTMVCSCNATYVSRGCCDAAEGLVWEPAGSNLATGTSEEGALVL